MIGAGGLWVRWAHIGSRCASGRHCEETKARCRATAKRLMRLRSLHPGRSDCIARSRRRKTLDAALGPGAGRELIETGVGPEYRLAPGASAALDARLTDMDVAAAPDVLDELRRRCPLVEAERVRKLLSDCYPQSEARV
jgi:hypothetical protein